MQGATRHPHSHVVLLLTVQGGNVTQRRSQVCAYLGLGECDGKQLLRQLNLYGFTRDDVERALAWAANSAAAQL